MSTNTVKYHNLSNELALALQETIAEVQKKHEKDFPFMCVTLALEATLARTIAHAVEYVPNTTPNGAMKMGMDSSGRIVTMIADVLKENGHAVTI